MNHIPEIEPMNIIIEPSLTNLEETENGKGTKGLK